MSDDSVKVENAYFKCLRCGHTYVGEYRSRVVEERTCTRCGSNSVRRLKSPPKSNQT